MQSGYLFSLIFFLNEAMNTRKLICILYLQTCLIRKENSPCEIPISKNSNKPGWAWGVFPPPGCSSFLDRNLNISIAEANIQRPAVWLSPQVTREGVLFGWGTHRLGCFYGHKSVVSFLPTNVAKGSVVCDVLCNVGNFMNSMVMLKGLRETKGRADLRGLPLRAVNQWETCFSYAWTGPQGLGKAVWSRWKERELCLPMREGGSPPRS